MFTYSERPDTPAAAYHGRVETKTRFKRNEILRVLGEKKKHAFASSFHGTIMPVLVEGAVREGMRSGFTPNYIKVQVPASSASENEIVMVRMQAAKDGDCTGIVDEVVAA